MWNVRCIWKSLVDLTLAEGSRKTHALRLKKNLYGTHQAGRVWNQHLHKGLIQRGYVQSLIDLCVYYKGKTVFMVYVDNGIFSGPDSAEIDELISSLANDTRYQTYQITDEGPVERLSRSPYSTPRKRPHQFDSTTSDSTDTGRFGTSRQL